LVFLANLRIAVFALRQLIARTCGIQAAILVICLRGTVAKILGSSCRAAGNHCEFARISCEETVSNCRLKRLSWSVSRQHDAATLLVGPEDCFSFVITPAKQLLFCFSEKKGGDALTLVAKVRGCSVKEAAGQIAAHFGAKGINRRGSEHNAASKNNEFILSISRKYPDKATDIKMPTKTRKLRSSSLLTGIIGPGMCASPNRLSLAHDPLRVERSRRDEDHPRMQGGHPVRLRHIDLARGGAIPISMLEGRLKCPACGSRHVVLLFDLPRSPVTKRA
jgi:hypothetical protein